MKWAIDRIICLIALIVAAALWYMGDLPPAAGAPIALLALAGMVR